MGDDGSPLSFPFVWTESLKEVGGRTSSPAASAASAASGAARLQRFDAYARRGNTHEKPGLVAFSFHLLWSGLRP